MNPDERQIVLFETGDILPWVGPALAERFRAAQLSFDLAGTPASAFYHNVWRKLYNADNGADL